MSETFTLDYQETTGFLEDFDVGKFPHQRMGQAFVNRFLRGSDAITKSLFYIEDEKAARRMIWGFCS